MSNKVEHRIARSTPDDSTINTLDTQVAPSFAVMELLDDRDSQYFRKFLTKRKWREITPEAHIKKKTYKESQPSEDEVEQFADIEPDWFYISGHYARTTWNVPGAVLTPLPTGFFNEPFHVKEWESAWGKTSNKSFFLQCETLAGSDLTKFKDAMKRHWHRSPYGPTGTAADPTDRDKVIDEWSGVWTKPTEERTVDTTKAPAARGLFCGNSWPEAKVVLLVGCNTHTWVKTAFLDAFPAALILGYIDKNPANGTPHIVAFLKNLYKGITDYSDPKLSDHDHIATAWMDVFHKQRLTKSHRMVYMKPDGKVFGIVKSGGRYKTEEVGKDNETIIRRPPPRQYEYVRKTEYFGWRT